MSSGKSVLVQKPSISLMWDVNIEEFKAKKCGESLVSPSFFSVREKDNWWFVLHPKNTVDYLKNFSRLYLHYAGPELTATVTTSIINKDGFEKLKQVRKDVFSQGHYMIFPTFFDTNYVMDPSNDILNGQNLTISCTIISHTEKIQVRDEAQRLKFFGNIEKLLTDIDLSDVTVKVGKKCFYLHKCILCAHSTVFERMFKNEMEEKSNNLVKIDDVEYEILEEFFRFLYTATISDGAKDKLGKILMVAEKYCVEELKEFCETLMRENLSKTNAVEYYNSAVLNNAKTLESAAASYMFSYIDKFTRNPKFKNLEVQHPEVLINVFEEFKKVE